MSDEEQVLKNLAYWRRRAVVAEEERGRLLDVVERLLVIIELSVLEERPLASYHLLDAREHARLTIGGLSRKPLN